MKILKFSKKTTIWLSIKLFFQINYSKKIANWVPTILKLTKMKILKWTSLILKLKITMNKFNKMVFTWINLKRAAIKVKVAIIALKEMKAQYKQVMII